MYLFAHFVLRFRSRNTEDLVHEWNQVQESEAEVSPDIHQETAERAEEREQTHNHTFSQFIVEC